MDVDTAIKLSGLSRSRFYRLAAEWRSAPSLTALGALVGAGGSRVRHDPEAINALQAKVSQVVRLNGGVSVSQLVRHLVAESGLAANRLPGTIKLREIVETELRRVAATQEAGNAVKFDCSAINLPRADRRPYILFACLDVGTGLVLGTSIRDTADAEQGYRDAAADARTRLSGSLARLPWARRLANVEMTAGADVDRSIALVHRLLAGGLAANLQLASAPGRYGRYIRKLAGTRIGRIEITPTRTEQGSVQADNDDVRPWTMAEAAAAVTRSFDDHNATLLPKLEELAQGRPPEALDHLLDLLSRS